MSALIELRHVRQEFAGPEGQPIVVLEDIDLALEEGEIVALLGKSGSGKSTILRLIAGLMRPTSGEVLYRGAPVDGPVPGISMVFQNFALFPWLDVLANVRLGLEAQGVAPDEQRQRALEAIDMIGLDGFESAYPKELSGGMRQRVGFARALVVRPDVLLMDEPFSALDVPTAETLRDDLLDLWRERKIPTRAILMVSHDIEESLLLVDRLVILDNNPGRIKAMLPVRQAHPRDRNSKTFRALVDRVYAAMTRAAVLPPEVINEALASATRLPNANVQQMLGVLDSVHDESPSGRIDLAELADTLEMAIDELFPVLEALELLGFAQVAEGRFELTQSGRAFLDADILLRKQLFRRALQQHVPLAREVFEAIQRAPEQRVDEEQFLANLNTSLTDEEAERVLELVIGWGRYAELFAYDFDSGEFSLENPGAEVD